MGNIICSFAYLGVWEMNRKLWSAVALLIPILVLSLPTHAPASVGPFSSVIRLGGLDRFETASLVAEEVSANGLAGSTVVLASGLNFPDALVGGAWSDPGVILLTRPNEIPLPTLKILNEPSVTEVRIVGGTAVVSLAVEEQVRKLGKSVERYAGPTRYETALKVFTSETKDRKTDSLWIASGISFADQLVAVSAARRVGGAVAIVAPWQSLSATTVTTLKNGLKPGAVVHIVDGSRALDLVAIPGHDLQRHVADPFTNSVSLQTGFSEHTYVASGENWPDALAASRLITDETRLLLSRHLCSPKSVLADISSALKAGKGTLIGGPVAIGNTESLGTECPLGETPASSPRDLCRIPQFDGGYENSDYRGVFSTGFPFQKDNVLPDQEVSLLMIPIDWDNHVGSVENLNREIEQIKIFMNLYSTMSEGRLTFRAIYGGGGTEWYRLPEPIENYPQTYSSDFNSKVAQHAIDAIDEEVDFTQVDLTILVFPDYPPIPVTDNPEHGFASMQHFNQGGSRSDWRNVFSDEGFVRNYVGGAGFFDDPQRPVWSYYVHEVGHVLSLPDWYLRALNQGEDYDENLNVSQKLGIGPMSTWDAMSTQDGPSRTFASWTRWLLGWLDESRVTCYEIESLLGGESFDFELVPLNIYEPGVKAVMIRTGPNEGLVIESRRPIFPDHDLIWWETIGRKPYGLLVYRVDTTKGNAMGALTVLPPEGQGVVELRISDRLDPRMMDGLYNPGAKGLVSGLKIELISTGARDIVRMGPA